MNYTWLPGNLTLFLGVVIRPLNFRNHARLAFTKNENHTINPRSTKSITSRHPSLPTIVWATQTSALRAEWSGSIVRDPAVVLITAAPK